MDRTLVIFITLLLAIPDVSYGDKKICPVNFGIRTYGEITSRCKPPSFAPEPCCSALFEYACPFSKILDDQSNVCAVTLFYYANHYGGFPSDLFNGTCLKPGDTFSTKCPKHQA